MSIYHFFSKLGYHKRQLEWIPILVVRIFLGLFFAVSGFFKMFDAKGRASLFQTLKEHQIPFPEFNVYLLPTLQLLFGLCILIGLLTTVSCFIVFILRLASMFAEGLSTVTRQSELPFIEHFFYFPEVLYVLMVFWLFFSGPGKISFDYTYRKRRRKELL